MTTPLTCWSPMPHAGGRHRSGWDEPSWPPRGETTPWSHLTITPVWVPQRWSTLRPVAEGSYCDWGRLVGHWANHGRSTFRCLQNKKLRTTTTHDKWTKWLWSPVVSHKGPRIECVGCYYLIEPQSLRVGSSWEVKVVTVPRSDRY